jgi:hypothetical protein
MQVAKQLDLVTIERLRREGELLLKMYEAEFSIDPTSVATESSRSNLIALHSEQARQDAAEAKLALHLHSKTHGC